MCSILYVNGRISKTANGSWIHLKVNCLYKLFTNVEFNLDTFY